MVPDKKPSGLGTELHREVLLDLKARATSDGRSAITVSEPDNPQVLVFRHMADRICEKVSVHAEQRATRIVIDYTGIIRAQPKLPVSRKESGKPTMNGDL